MLLLPQHLEIDWTKGTTFDLLKSNINGLHGEGSIETTAKYKVIQIATFQPDYPVWVNKSLEKGSESGTMPKTGSYFLYYEYR